MCARDMEIIKKILVLESSIRGITKAYSNGDILIDERDKQVNDCKQQIKKLREEARRKNNG